MSVTEKPKKPNRKKFKTEMNFQNALSNYHNDMEEWKYQSDVRVAWRNNFAANALQGLIVASSSRTVDESTHVGKNVSLAVEYADALLEKLEE